MHDLRKHPQYLILHRRVRWGSRLSLARCGRFAAILICLAAGACKEALRGLGPSGAALERNADQLFGAFVIRYTQVSRDPKYELARNQLNRNALVPSRVFDDSAVWTSEPSPVLRALVVQGMPQPGRYVFISGSAPSLPSRLGESRHLITLARLSPNEFVWDTNVDFALGTVSAAEIGSLTTALLGSAERGTEQELRANYRAVTPRTAAVMESLFSIDSIRTTPFSDGTSDVRITIGLHTDRLEPRFPAFAGYVAKYANPAHYRASLADRSGATWFEVTGADRQFSIHYRTMHGRLAPLHGAPRARPDTMELRIDFTTKLKLFTVGLQNLVTDFVITETPHERAWTLTAKREPSWKLPLITEHLIRTPLHRPFDGTGVIFHLGVRDSADAQTLFERRAHATVQESGILRFLNSLGSGAMSDLADRTEREEEQFLREVFIALQADARALAPSLGAGEDPNAGSPSNVPNP